MADKSLVFITAAADGTQGLAYGYIEPGGELSATTQMGQGFMATAAINEAQDTVVVLDGAGVLRVTKNPWDGPGLVTWQAGLVPSDGNYDYRQVKYDKTIGFYVNMISGIYYSADGLTWTQHNKPAITYALFSPLVYANGYFYMFDFENSGKYYRSVWNDNTGVWTEFTYTTQTPINTPTQAVYSYELGGILVTTGSDQTGSPKLFWLPDGGSIAPVALAGVPAGLELRGLHYSKVIGKFIGIWLNGGSYTTFDGVTAFRSPGNTPNLANAPTVRTMASGRTSIGAGLTSNIGFASDPSVSWENHTRAGTTYTVAMVTKASPTEITGAFTGPFGKGEAILVQTETPVDIITNDLPLLFLESNNPIYADMDPTYQVAQIGFRGPMGRFNARLTLHPEIEADGFVGPFGRFDANLLYGTTATASFVGPMGSFAAQLEMFELSASFRGPMGSFDADLRHYSIDAGFVGPHGNFDAVVFGEDGLFAGFVGPMGAFDARLAEVSDIDAGFVGPHGYFSAQLGADTRTLRADGFVGPFGRFLAGLETNEAIVPSFYGPMGSFAASLDVIEQVNASGFRGPMGKMDAVISRGPRVDAFFRGPRPNFNAELEKGIGGGVLNLLLIQP